MTRISEAFTTDHATAPWGVWVMVWRPLRNRWCLVLDQVDARPWTAAELAVEPRLAFTMRPISYGVGSVAVTLDCASKLIPPWMNVPEDSPFWTRPLGKIA